MMKKIITLVMCLICCCSYAFLYEGNGGQWLSEDIAVGSGGSYVPPEIDPDLPIVKLDFYNGETKISTSQFNVGTEVEPAKILALRETGNTFLGWQDEDDEPITTITINADTSVYARWAVSNIRRITWVVIDESQSPAVTTSQVTRHTVGNVVNSSPTPPTIPSGYDWLDYDYFETGMTMPDQDLTYTAKITQCPVYGFTITNSSQFAYTDDAIGMDELTYLNVEAAGNFNNTATSWKSFIYEIAKPCMMKPNGDIAYYLYQDDVRLKEDGATASELASNWTKATDTGNNAMVEIGRLYTCVDYDETNDVLSFKVSRAKKNNSYKATGFIKSDGTLCSHIYVGMFQTPRLSATSVWRSVNVNAAPGYSTGWKISGSGSGNQFIGIIDDLNYSAYQSYGYRCIDYNISQLLLNLQMLMYKKIPGWNENYAPMYGKGGTVRTRVFAGETLNQPICCGKGKFMWMEYNGVESSSDANRFVIQGIILWDNHLLIKDRPPFNVVETSYTDTGIVQSSNKVGKLKIKAYNNVIIPTPVTDSNSLYNFDSNLFNRVANSSMCSIPNNGFWWFNGNLTDSIQTSQQYPRIIYTVDNGSHGESIAPPVLTMMMSAPRRQTSEEPEYEEPIIATESEEIQ